MNRRFSLTFAVALLVMLGTVEAVGEVVAKIPAGTSVEVRITDKLNSETANVGQPFHGVLAAPITANGRTFPRGASVTGEVVNIERSGRLSTPGELHLTLRTIRTGGRTYAVSVRTIVIKGESHTKSNVTKIGGGTAMGALIGAIAGGGKGAAIGAGVGAAAGTGVAAGTGKKPAEVQPETVLAWVADGAAPGALPQARDPRQSSDNRNAQEENYRANQRYSRQDDGPNEDYAGRLPSGFSDQDRQIISDCFVNDRAGLPPGLAKKDRLPPGLERHLQRNGTLPPGLQKRVQPLPGSCVARLPRLPRDWSRVVLGGRIILLDPRQTIVDLFWVGRD
jgi:outer membrane lipoprotein SlyB